ncbi:MAG: acetolactate decarboxylase [Alphaproteobacteria bacterium]
MGRHHGFIALALALVVSACGSDVPPSASQQNDTVFQYSTLNALLNGLYDGEMTIGEVAQYGDMGLGTIHGIDGELIALDGAFYSAHGDGSVTRLTDDVKTPFAVVATFNPDKQAALDVGLNYQALQDVTDKLIRAPNHFQAIRIDGVFRTLKLRSEPKQKPPYRPLADVLKNEQVVFDYEKIAGTMIGFRMPAFIAGLNVPGYHFHFVSEDRTKGGHVLELEVASGTILIDELHRFEMALPGTDSFQAVNLGGTRESEVNAVER